MTNKLKIFFFEAFNLKQKLILVCGIILFLLSNLDVNAQSNPRTLQNLSFGIFYSGSTGGSVIMPSVGSRSSTGSVVLFSSDVGHPARIRIRLDWFSLYVITAGNIVDLTNGTGGSMTLQINDIYPATPFLSFFQQDYDFYIGGTLTVGSPAITPAGNYSGSFDIIFNEQ